MVLALPVHHPHRNKSILLQAGLVLDDALADRLGQLRLREIWIKFPGTEVISKYLNPALFEARAKLAGRITDAFEQAGEPCQTKLDFAPYRSAVTSLLETILSDTRSALFIEEILAHGEPTLRHASNVCFMSLLMGLTLDEYLIAERSRLAPGDARDVSSLGLGAMLHDVGMLRLDDATLDRWAATGDEGDAAWREHVEIGYNVVRETVGPSASAVVLHHHQRFDGSGFPLRARADGTFAQVAGRDIHVFARIVAAADLFDRLRFGPDAPGDRGNDTPLMPTVRALKLLQSEPIWSWLDPVVVDAMLDVVPAYTPGSLVRLSDGQECLVRTCNARDPCRPRVQPINFDADHDRLRAREPVVIDLSKSTDLHIAHAEGFDVSDDNFDRTADGTYSFAAARRKFGSMRG